MRSWTVSAEEEEEEEDEEEEEELEELIFTNELNFLDVKNTKILRRNNKNQKAGYGEDKANERKNRWFVST